MEGDQVKLALYSDCIITPNGAASGTILCEQGVIKDLIPSALVQPEGYTLDKAEGLVVMPGLVDTHVHINQPGRTEWEGFETATKAAAAGGVTSLVDMPLNCSPVTTSAEALKIKLDESRPFLWVDCGFWGGLVPANHDRLEGLLESGVCGIKAFLTHSGLAEFPNVTEAHLRKAMPTLAKYNLPLLVHAELESCVPPAERQIETINSYSAYLNSRPDAWEVEAIALMIKLAQTYECPVHIVHLSSAQALPLIAQAKAAQLPVSVETCPHYLSLCAEDIADGSTLFKCAPPIRQRANAEALWQGLQGTVVDMIVSDHSPCSPDLKLLAEGDFTRAWGGISSLQLTLPLVWTLASEMGSDLSRLATWLCEAPARLAGLDKQKGKIARGYDADFVIWNQDARFRVSAKELYTRHKLSPYLAKDLRGAVERTYLRGKKIFDKGKFGPGPSGMPLLKNQNHLMGRE